MVTLIPDQEGGSHKLPQDEKMKRTVLEGTLRMMREYKRLGKEQHNLVQITCDQEVEADFLAEMNRERIKQLPPSCDPIRLKADHTVQGAERAKQETEHGKQVYTQWRRSAGMSGLGATRDHFNKWRT